MHDKRKIFTSWHAQVILRVPWQLSVLVGEKFWIWSTSCYVNSKNWVERKFIAIILLRQEKENQRGSWSLHWHGISRSSFSSIYFHYWLLDGRLFTREALLKGDQICFLYYKVFLINFYSVWLCLICIQNNFIRTKC